MNPSLRRWLENGVELTVTGLGAAISTALAAAVSNPDEYKLGSGKCLYLALYSLVIGVGLKLGHWLTQFHFSKNGNGK